MEAIIRIQQIRASDVNHPKKSAFRVRKRPVNPAKIDRYIKEHPMQSLSANKEGNMDVNMDSVGMIPTTSRHTRMNDLIHI